MTGTLDDGALRDVAAAARAEWRADEEEWTRAAVERWRHGRTVLDLAREHMHRGDTLRVAVGDARFTGVVVSVGHDVLTLAVPDGRVDVHARAGAPLAWHVVSSARTGGTRGEAAGTFRTRLLQLETDDRVVEVGAAALDDVYRGGIVVGRDHVIVDDGDGTVATVALAAVGWVREAAG